MGDEKPQVSSNIASDNQSPDSPKENSNSSSPTPGPSKSGDESNQTKDTNLDTQPKKQASDETSSACGQNKIEVFFRNTGNAPIMKKSKWAVNSSFTVSDSISFIRKYLKLDSSQSIFIYVNQSFAPALDQTIQNLFDCYESDKKLILYYATTQAWG